jgi:UDP-N-acetylmuramate dehydrogenase
MAVGGAISYLVEPRDSKALVELINTLSTAGINYRILGAGSNLLIPDEGVSEVVIRLGEGFRALSQMGGGLFSVGAAFSVMRLSRDLSMAGFSGLEFAGGIPASLGGALTMNAGAHGGEFGDVLERIEIVLPDGTKEIVERSSLAISYRNGSLPKGCIVVRGEIRLVESDKDVVSERRSRYLAHRKATQPLHLPSAGSVFRNPVGQFAGEIIERCQMKGLREGGAEISNLHANWIVNSKRSASAKDVRNLIASVIETVRSKEGVELEPEIRVW